MGLLYGCENILFIEEALEALDSLESGGES